MKQKFFQKIQKISMENIKIGVIFCAMRKETDISTAETGLTERGRKESSVVGKRLNKKI